MSFLIIVSHYNAWQPSQLINLLDQLLSIPGGGTFDICVVVNQEKQEKLILPERLLTVSVLYRENVGYNIGAWEHGWRENLSYDCYLFLQEECVIVRSGWLQAFHRLVMRRDVGLVGESLNWAGLSWKRLARQYRAFSFWASVDREPVPVTTAVIAGLRQMNVPEGRTGAHLQSLVLCARREVLEAINGFPVRANYDEATIAEIAISKKVEALGLKVREVGPGSFRFILHPQWVGRQGIIRSYIRLVARLVPVKIKELFTSKV